MKKAKFTTKALLSLIIVVMLISSMSVFSFAADSFTNANLSYGEIVPTDSKLEAQKQSYTIYGDSAELYFMQISKGKLSSHFCIEIFNDKSYQNQIQSYSAPYSVTAGNKAIKLTWNLKNLSSGAYYGRCYSYIENEDNRTIDSKSMKTFVLNIDRLSKREVKLVSNTNTATGPRITWEAVPTAKTYNIYRRAAGEKSWTYLYTERNGATSYTDTKATSGKYYAYTVKAYDGKYVSLYNTKGLNSLYLSMPAISVNGSGAAGVATLKWSKVPGATGYYVYRKGGSLSDYTWKLVATIKNANTVSYTDTSAKSTDWQYTYTVKAYSGKYVSAYNYAGVDFDYLPAPTLSKAYSYENGMRIEWKLTNPNVTRYYVYRKDGTSWKYIGGTVMYEDNNTNKIDTFFVDTTAVSNTTYTYTVKAVSDTNAGAYNATGITAKFLKAPVLQNLTFDSSYKALVKWEKVTGAAGYKVYRKIADATSWTLIATIKNGATTYYNDACGKSSGTKYTYTVRAFDSKDLHSYFDTDGTSAVCLAKPLFTVSQTFDENNNSGIEVKWSAINGATKYNVYRRISGTTWEHLMDGVTETAYLDTTAEIGITYDYAVRALNDNGDISYFYTRSVTPVERPVVEAVVHSATEGTRVTWSALENADSYTVYRQAKDSDEMEAIATVTDATEYLDESVEAKTLPFFYTVSATFNGTESATRDGVANFVLASISAEFKPATEESAPAIQVTVSYEDGAMAGIFKTANDEAPVRLDGVTGSFTDTGITEGTEYTYTLAVTKSGKLENQVSASVKYPHPPLAKAIITGCEGDYNEGDPFVVLTWDGVEFADEYIIYRAENGGEWTEVGKVPAETAPDFPEVDNVPDNNDPNEGDIDGPSATPDEPNEPDIPTIGPEEPDVPVIPDIPENGGVPEEPVEPEEIPDELNAISEDDVLAPDESGTPVIPEIPEIENVPDDNDPNDGDIGGPSANPDEPTTEPDDIQTVVPDAPKYTFKDELISSEIEYSYKVVAVATKSERASSESETTTCFIKTGLNALTGIKFEGTKTEDDKIAVTITWDEVLYAEKYEIRRYLPGEDIKGTGHFVNNISADAENLSVTDTIDMNVEYIYKITASSEDRGEVSNTATYCWTEFPDADDYISLTTLKDTLDGDIIKTQTLKCEDISALAVANAGCTLEATKAENGYFGTGTVVNVYKDGELVKAYTLVVKTDINGDGVCDALDLAELEKYIGNHSELDSFALDAADLNNDGIVDNLDYELFGELANAD